MYTFPFSLQSNLTITHNSEMMHYCYSYLVNETLRPLNQQILVQILTFYYNGHHFLNQKFKQVIPLWNKILELQLLQKSPQMLLGSPYYLYS